MKNFKNLLNGVIVGVLTFVYWLFIMTLGDRFRMEHREYRDEITFGFIISSIVLNIILIYIFYAKSSDKNIKTIFLITIPYVLLLVGVEIVSPFVPRVLDIVFILIGSYLIYKIQDYKRENNHKPVLILGTYLITVSLSYTYLFNLIQGFTGQY